MNKTFIDMTDKIIKNWKVIQRGIPTSKNTSNSVWWVCQCIICGKRKTFNGAELRLNRVGQCKHKNKSQSKNQKVQKLFDSRVKDETNKKYGKLTVLSFAYAKNSFAYWNCICDCGTQKIVKGAALREGRTKSCGCVISWKQQEIKQILINNNILFQKEYSFPDLKDLSYLRFDFAIFDNNNLKGLIQYYGRQHYQEDCQYNHYGLLQKHDVMKIEYCQQKNIPLLILNKDNILQKDILEWIKSLDIAG